MAEGNIEKLFFFFTFLDIIVAKHYWRWSCCQQLTVGRDKSKINQNKSWWEKWREEKKINKNNAIYFNECIITTIQ